ncbi:MAG: DNA polymerase III subunit gamma/tau [Proteobacteria bacterium]|nr:DNA polymerase III subunit gamma/tau [Pseudomonadota bacterium]
MSDYQVIARKWRPTLFSEIVGQEHVTRTLANGVESGRISHAYIFSGPRGVGKTTAARILARCLNCENGPVAVPCNTCSQCKAITTGASTDVFEIDGASNNSVDNIRELRESVKYLPSEGKYRVYIIDEVHMLSNQAFNALLKTLEEPPAHAVFIFATTEIHKIPLTILSRCQRLDFKRIPLGLIQQHLKKIVETDGIPYDDGALYALARGGDGSLRDAQSLLEQVLAFGGGEVRSDDVVSALGLMDRTALFDMLEAMVLKDGAKCLNLVEKIYNFGYDLKRASADLIEAVRDLNVVSVTMASGEGARAYLPDLPDHEYDRLVSLAKSTGIERLQMLFTIISKVYEEVSKSEFPRYALEMALVKAARFDEVRSVAAIAESLKKLSSGVSDRTTEAAPRVSDRFNTESSSSARMTGTAPEPPKAKVAAAPELGSNEAGAQKVESRPVESNEVAAQKVESNEVGANETDAPYSTTATGSAPDGFLTQIQQRNPDIGAALKTASIDVEGDVVRITAPERRLEFKLSASRAELDKLCRDFFGRKMRIEVGVGTGTQEVKRGPEPLVQEALEVFGGKVLEESRRSTNV